MPVYVIYSIDFEAYYFTFSIISQLTAFVCSHEQARSIEAMSPSYPSVWNIISAQVVQWIQSLFRRSTNEMAEYMGTAAEGVIQVS